ncbi:MAG: ferredoxin [Candidatus Limnocylindrales bacterium]
MTDRPKLKIDWVACNGYGVCEAAAPDLIFLDDWGYPVLHNGAVPPGLIGQANRAINDCPMLALAWESEEMATGGRLARILGRRS